ncbi:MAG: hypothetical protein AAF194_08035, partial [Pseudomonadota bacterium]
ALFLDTCLLTSILTILPELLPEASSNDSKSDSLTVGTLVGLKGAAQLIASPFVGRLTGAIGSAAIALRSNDCARHRLQILDAAS